ncbi:MAG: hypothetical protein E5W38_32285, partial [Mesorhizobium sp.]
PARHLISPLAGEMSGRTEGGVTERGLCHCLLCALAPNPCPPSSNPTAPSESSAARRSPLAD